MIMNRFVKTPDRITAAAFNRYLNGQVLADSSALQWTGLYVRLCRLPPASVTTWKSTSPNGSPTTSRSTR